MSPFAGEGRAEVTDPGGLISVDRWRELILGDLPALDAIELRIQDALGLVLAEPVESDEAVPSFANSAMDGYAVRVDDVAGAGVDDPVELRIAGEVRAGASELTAVGPGSAVAIMTGAPLPPGAEAVVPVESTSAGASGRIRIHRAARKGDHVRGVGEDVSPGQQLLPAGHRIRPADVGLLAAIGRSRVHVRPAPRVVILSTGDELVPLEQRPEPGRIRDANGPMLGALVRQAGGLPYSAGIVRDDRKAMMYAFDSNLGHADLLIATGGVSAGAYDHVQEVIGKLGKVRAEKVAVKPGMPQVYGRIGTTPVFGLPGNPVSSFVSFELFVRPAIRALQGRADVARPQVTARLTRAVSAPAHKRTFVRVRLKREAGRWTAEPGSSQGSHVLTSLVRADGLADIPEEVTSLAVGDEVTVHLLVDT
ncbi:MAG: molybdopterin molybdotransferase MoeA [Actinobacteria bacterium]|nr:molybdopterin molybdotransferase MoeA [Actinomycetota bacterium]